MWVCGCVGVGVWGVGVGGARPKVKTKKLRFFRIFFLNWSVRTRQFHCPIRTFQFCPLMETGWLVVPALSGSSGEKWPVEKVVFLW